MRCVNAASLKRSVNPCSIAWVSWVWWMMPPSPRQRCTPGHSHRGMGRRALSTELRRRGVPEEIVDEAVATVRPEDEEQRARELVRRKLRTSTVRDASTLARKLGGMLARKGYSERLAWRVIRDEFALGDWPVEIEPCPD
jgi:hypothetical protein